MVEWDMKKNIANVRKHGISFEEAVEVFDDPYMLEYYDFLHSTADEDRYISIGLTKSVELLMVVWSISNETIRLISAREASLKERNAYYEGYRRKNS